jgi:hypothetical protein
VFAVVSAPLRPLAIFVPPVVTRPGKPARRDWSLTLVAFAQASMAMIFGGIPYKIQYALSRFSWTSVDIGYWLTSIGIARATHLAIVLPSAWLGAERRRVLTRAGSLDQTPQA